MLHSNKSDPRDLSHAVLVEKVIEVLKAGGEPADTLSNLILMFHRELRRRRHEGAPAETGADDDSSRFIKGKDLIGGEDTDL